MYFIYQILYFLTMIAFFYVLLQFTKFQSLSKLYVGWNKSAEKIPFLNSAFGKIVVLILLLILSRIIEINQAKSTNYFATEVAEAPARAPAAEAPPVNSANAWQRDFFYTANEYFRKTSIYDNYSPVNKTRAEQEKYDEMVAAGKAAIENAKGKTLNDQTCFYLGYQRVADTVLWCYTSRYSPDFLFKIKISEAEAKKLGQLYKDDQYIFSGTIDDIERESMSYNAGNPIKIPPTIKITALSIELKK